MNIFRTVLNTLNVRREEWWMVRKLFILQFFQGAGIAFFYTTASTKFLHNFPITDLAYLYLLSAVMLGLTGIVYSRFEHRLGIAKIYVLITVVMALSMLLFWLAASWVHADWFFYLIFGWYHVLYLLNNLSFWGLASQLYDVRQSKRLFAVISAGDIPAKFIGYSSALVIVSYVGINNLLLAGFICMLVSFPYLRTVLRSAKQELVHDDHHHKPGKLDSSVGVLLKNYTVNKLIRRVAVMSLLISLCIILLNYSFYAEVKETKSDDVALAKFIALFLAVGRLAAMATKMVFASRLVDRLGHAKALLFTPAVLIAFSVILLFISGPNENKGVVLYVFGTAAIIIDVMRSSITMPVLLSLMQPLSTTQRLRAHNIIKGFMDPFAYFLCGILLLLLFTREWYSLYTISYILLFVAVGWMFNIILVNRQYLQTLIKTVSSRYFSQEEFNLSDRETQKMVEQKIESGTELEVFYILNMLSTRKAAENEPLILKALEHSSSRVVIEALRLVAVQKIVAALPTVRSLITNHEDVHVKSNSIKVLAESGTDDYMISGFLYQPDKELQQAAIVAILNFGSTSSKYPEAVSLLSSLVESANEQDKREALQILSQIRGSGFEKELLALLDGDISVIKIETIRTIGMNPSADTVKALFAYLPTHEKEVLISLSKAGNISLPMIRENLLQGDLKEKQKLNLIALCGRMEGHKVHRILFGLLDDLPHYNPAIIRALQKSQFKASVEQRKKVEDLIRLYLIISAEILHMHRRINPKKDVYDLLHNSLQIELDDIKIILLCLFSFIYDSDQINKIRSALAIHKKETIANAMELVDMTVRKDFARPFTVIFETGDIEHRCNALKELFPKELFPEVDHILHAVLLDSRFSFNQWTRAVSLYTSKKHLHDLDKNLIQKYMGSEIQLLKETAEFAL